jgi:addiction module HigA family antidote
MYAPYQAHNIHPGEILLEEFMKPLGLTAYRVAKDIGVPSNRIDGLIRGNRNITADSAARLARYFGNSEQFWLNLQASYDATQAKEKMAEIVAKITPLAETAHGKKAYSEVE